MGMDSVPCGAVLRAFAPVMSKMAYLPTASPTKCFSSFRLLANLMSEKWYLSAVVIRISLHIFICLRAIFVSFCVCQLTIHIIAHFSMEFRIFFPSVFKYSLYIRDISFYYDCVASSSSVPATILETKNPMPGVVY